MTRRVEKMRLFSAFVCTVSVCIMAHQLASSSYQYVIGRMDVCSSFIAIRDLESSSCHVSKK